jgi:hypothetical protein
LHRLWRTGSLCRATSSLVFGCHRIHARFRVPRHICIICLPQVARWLSVPRHSCSKCLPQIAHWLSVPRHIFYSFRLPQNAYRFSVPRHICSIWVPQNTRPAACAGAISVVSGCHRSRAGSLSRATSSVVFGCHRFYARLHVPRHICSICLPQIARRVPVPRHNYCSSWVPKILCPVTCAAPHLQYLLATDRAPGPCAAPHLL